MSLLLLQIGFVWHAALRCPPYKHHKRRGPPRASRRFRVSIHHISPVSSHLRTLSKKNSPRRTRSARSKAVLARAPPPRDRRAPSVPCPARSGQRAPARSSPAGRGEGEGLPPVRRQLLARKRNSEPRCREAHRPASTRCEYACARVASPEPDSQCDYRACCR